MDWGGVEWGGGRYMHVPIYTCVYNCIQDVYCPSPQANYYNLYNVLAFLSQPWYSLCMIELATMMQAVTKTHTCN